MIEDTIEKIQGDIGAHNLGLGVGEFPWGNAIQGEGVVGYNGVMTGLGDSNTGFALDSPGNF